MVVVVVKDEKFLRARVDTQLLATVDIATGTTADIGKQHETTTPTVIPATVCGLESKDLGTHISWSTDAQQGGQVS
jgi:hypothetical protein